MQFIPHLKLWTEDAKGIESFAERLIAQADIYEYHHPSINGRPIFRSSNCSK